ncbi:MAG: hypothetical protein PF692_08390 [Kiritimatiellae bacterium]|jgi:hypothetical protein|nr:hypothetical protein [Kiritimatiellia bacterium]
MKKLLSFTTVALLVTSTLFAATTREIYYVVQQTNFLKDKGFRIYNDEEYKDLQEQLKLEKRYYSQAVKQAQEEWKKDETNTNPFPTYAIAPRTMMLKGKYTDKEQADEKLAKLKDSEYQKLYGNDKKSKKGGYKKPKKSEEDILKEEQKRLMGVEAGKAFQETYSDYVKEKTGKEAPTYVEHVELEKRN